MGNLNSAPRSVRLHIGLFGSRNSGKSSLLNSISNHSFSVVSSVAGTTTDPVYKSIELHGLGPCVLIDTAGFDDEGDLGKLRIEKTLDAYKRTDIAIVLFPLDKKDFKREIEWAKKIKRNKKPLLAVISKSDLSTDSDQLSLLIEKELSIKPLFISSKDKNTQNIIRENLIRVMPENLNKRSIVGNLVEKNDVVMLVMPQQINAPKGRLILPQVQTTRDLLDNHCIIMSVGCDEIDKALSSLKNPPKLIITDSQVFPLVYRKKPSQSKLTSFSVLLSAVKGDVEEFAKASYQINKLTESSKVLIAEACTHAPLTEDIGRIKIPRLLRKKVGEKLQIDFVSGSDFPNDLSEYDLVIHCAGCMFNRSYMLNRLETSKKNHVAMTNYGIAIAQLSGILDFIEY